MHGIHNDCLITAVTTLEFNYKAGVLPCIGYYDILLFAHNHLEVHVPSYLHKVT